jgi:hypothetical protein
MTMLVTARVLFSLFCSDNVFIKTCTYIAINSCNSNHTRIELFAYDEIIREKAIHK